MFNKETEFIENENGVFKVDVINPQNFDFFTSHKFNVGLAQKHGLNEAIILENIIYWVKKNKANNKNFYDGKHWTYNSIKAFHELIPYLSEKQIRTALKNLENNGVIITGNYNKLSYDRTLWYTTKHETLLPFGQMENTKKANGNTEKGEPIPINKPINKTHINIMLLEILSYWNEKKIIVHNDKIFLANIKKTHKDAIELYGIDEIKKAIDNYKLVLERKSWFKHKYDLLDFLYRSKSKPGILRFLDESFDINEYPSEKKEINQEEVTYKEL